MNDKRIERRHYQPTPKSQRDVGSKMNDPAPLPSVSRLQLVATDFRVFQVPLRMMSDISQWIGPFKINKHLKSINFKLNNVPF